MTPLAALYESLSWTGPVWSALFAGFAVIGFDGQMYLTKAGEVYLVGLASG